jgi:hypothetical protein
VGIIGIILFASLVVDYFEIEEGAIKIACDGMEALRSMSREFNMVKGGSNSFDISVTAQNYLARSLQ